MHCTLVLIDYAHKRVFTKGKYSQDTEVVKLQVFLESILHSICHTEKKILELSIKLPLLCAYSLLQFHIVA